MTERMKALIETYHHGRINALPDADQDMRTWLWSELMQAAEEGKCGVNINQPISRDLHAVLEMDGLRVRIVEDQPGILWAVSWLPCERTEIRLRMESQGKLDPMKNR